MLDLDARIDSTLFSSGKGARELYERFSTFMDRFYVGRWKRWVFIEPFSEAATIGLGGLILPFIGIKLIDLVVHNLLGA